MTKKGDEPCEGLSPFSVPPVNLRAGRGLKAKADNTASVLVVYLLNTGFVVALNGKYPCSIISG